MEANQDQETVDITIVVPREDARRFMSAYVDSELIIQPGRGAQIAALRVQVVSPQNRAPAGGRLEGVNRFRERYGARGALEIQDRQDLMITIASLPAFTDERSRTTVAYMAGLDSILSGFDFGGNPRTVAGELIQRLENHGEVDNRPGYYALGALLCCLCGLEDTPLRSKEYMEGLVRTYQLAP